jgi:5'-deoxynucleotidase
MAKIFDHLLNRNLAHVTRYNNRAQHFPESVAEHSFYTAYFTLILCQLLEKKKIKMDKAAALQMAVVHDVEEGLTGDIINPFKHYNDEVYRAIRKVSDKMVWEMFVDLPRDLQKKLYSLWKKEGEEETIEAQIVKAADKLSLLSKCSEEIQAGNNYFEDIYKSQLSGLKKLELPWWKKIRKEVLSGAEKEL